jgi:hypothetical protein
LVVWLNAEATRRVGAITAAYNWALHTALEKYDIEIPFPQRDLHVKSWVRSARHDGEGTPEGDRGLRRDLDVAGNDAARDVERGMAEASARRADTTPPKDPHAAR